MICQICGREPGDTTDGMGHDDGVPLGSLMECDLCGKLVCPDCLHESECCFDGQEEHLEENPQWAPAGWQRKHESLDSDRIEWVREGDF